MTKVCFSINWSLARLVGAAGLVAGLAACTSTGSVFAPSQPQANAAAHRSGGTVRINAASCANEKVYAISAQTASVEIFDPRHLHGGACGSITGFTIPQGLFVDGSGNVWVADAGAQSVYEFAPGGSTPIRTLSDPNGVPSDVVVDAASGTVYVTEYQNNVSPTTLVEVYAKGSTGPTGSMSDPDARNGGFAALDNQGNLYVSFMTQTNKAQVDRWTGGKGTPENLGLHLIGAAALATTASGALAACDSFAYTCGIFELGSKRMTHPFGHMGFGRRHRNVQPDKAPWLMPQDFALDRDEHRAYVAAESLTKWTFPGPAHDRNRLPLVEIKVRGNADEIAVSPAAAPGAPYH